MANTFLTMQTVARRALATLYNTTVLAGLAWRDYDPDFRGKVGDTITVRKPTTFEAKEFVRANGIEIQDVDEGSFDVTLDTILDVSFAVTAEELTLNIDDFAVRLLAPAMEAISQGVDSRLATEIVEGTDPDGNTVPDVSGSATDAKVLIDARKDLNKKKVPMSERYAVWSPEGAATLISDPLFHQADQRGDTDGLREASIGRKFGFDNFETQVLTDGGVAFHRSAVALVTRPLERPMGIADEQVAIETFKGLGLRVVREYDINKKQDVISVDLLCGFALIDADRAVKMFDPAVGS